MKHFQPMMTKTCLLSKGIYTLTPNLWFIECLIVHILGCGYPKFIKKNVFLFRKKSFDILIFLHTKITFFLTFCIFWFDIYFQTSAFLFLRIQLLFFTLNSYIMQYILYVILYTLSIRTHFHKWLLVIQRLFCINSNITEQTFTFFILNIKQYP